MSSTLTNLYKITTHLNQKLSYTPNQHSTITITKWRKVMNTGKKILAIVAITVVTATSIAWAKGGQARGGYWGGGNCFNGMGMTSGIGGGHPPFKFRQMIMQRVPEQRRSEALALMEQHRSEILDLRQKMMNSRFDLKRSALTTEWNEEAVRKHTAAMAETSSALMLKRARLKHDMRQLIYGVGK
jgi:hypothetical protein